MSDTNSVIIAVDAGTSSVRALAFDERLRIVDVARRPIECTFPHPGWVEQDPDEITRAVVDVLDEVARRLTDATRIVAAIGITNQRETVIAWDVRNGEPLHAAIVWQDRRTSERCRELIDDGMEPEVRATTGLVLDPYFSATKIEWLLRHGLDDDARDIPGLRMGTVDAWVIWNLTTGAEVSEGHGGAFVTDASNASRTMLMNTANLEWDPSLLDRFGIARRVLPDIVPSAGRVASIAPSVFGSTSPLCGVPISGIAGDQQAALLGQGCVRPNMAKVTYGTGSFVLANAGDTRPVAPDGLVATIAWDLGSCGPSGRSGVTHAIEGATFVSGAAIRWLRDELGIIERDEELASLAASVPDAAGVVFVPAFTGLGSPWWDPDARGTITGITRGTGRGHIARALIEAMAHQVDDMLTAMESAGVHCDRVGADGGASALDALLGYQADLSGVRVVRAGSIEATGLGAAMLAGMAEDVYPDLDTLVTHLPEGVEFERSSRDDWSAESARAVWHRAVDRAGHWG